MPPIIECFVFVLILFFTNSETNAQQQVHHRPKLFKDQYKWTSVNFTWPSVAKYQEALSSGSYVPENNAMAGIKYYKDKIYIALPRIRQGTPATLAFIPTSDKNETNLLLTPYPSWEMNAGNSCATLQNVQSMEIDPKGIMWVLDGNRFNNFTKCKPKLVLFDLNNNGSVVHSYEFEEEVCSMSGGFLNDLVVDAENDEEYAYITEHSDKDPGIIVYSRQKNKTWKIRDPSMFAEKDAADFSVGGISNNNHLHNVDGIALTPKIPAQNGEKLMIYCSISGFNLYGISNAILKNEDVLKGSNWRFEVKNLGRKPSQSDGMVVDNRGNLYYGLLGNYGVGKWNVFQPFAENATVVEENPEKMIWPDSFTLDDKGYLYVLANGINRYFNPEQPLKVDDEIKFRIFKTYTGTKNYFFE